MWVGVPKWQAVRQRERALEAAELLDLWRFHVHNVSEGEQSEVHRRTKRARPVGQWTGELGPCLSLCSAVQSARGRAGLTAQTTASYLEQGMDSIRTV